MRNLREHMVCKHGIPKQEVDRITNKRHQFRNYATHMSPGWMPATTPAVSASPAVSTVPGERSHVATVGQSRGDAC